MGRIELIIGCMYSGKTTEFMRRIMRYKTLNKKIIIYTHSSDTRYSEAGTISTHNRDSMSAIPKNSLKDIIDSDEFKNSDIICIEEAQFFPDLFQFTINAVDKHDKTLIICGLDGDFQMNPFMQVVQLIPRAESITKLNALCKKCGDGTEACFSRRIVESTERELVGSDGIYEAVCRYHYYN
jgi:thymidine kinase